MADLSASLNAELPRRGLSPAWLLAPIVLVGAYWRTRLLGDVAYWFDESFCLKMAEFSTGDIWRRAAQDTHPPLYFLLLKAWVAIFGSTPIAARGLSVMCGLATIVGTFFFVREAYRQDGPKSSSYTALTAAALVACSPIHIGWAQSVRMYAPAAMLAVFSAWFLMRALRRPEPRTLDWCAFTFTSVLLAGTHYYGWLTLVAEYLFVVGYVLKRPGSGAPQSQWRRVLPPAISASFVAVAWAALLPAFLDQRQRVMTAFWTKPLDVETLGSTFDQLFGVHEWAAASSTQGLVIAQAVVVGLLVLLGRGRPADLFVGLAASLPIVVAIALSLLGRSIFVPRYLLQAHLFLLIGGAVLLNRLPFRPVRLAAVGLTLVGMAVLSSKHEQFRERLANLPGMDAAIARFDEARHEGEPLIVCNPMLYTTVVGCTRHRADCFVQAGSYPFFHGTAVIKADEYFPVARLADENRRIVWTLGATDWMGDTWDVSLPEEWKPVGDWRFPEYYCGALVLRMHEREKISMTMSE